MCPAVNKPSQVVALDDVLRNVLCACSTICLHNAVKHTTPGLDCSACIYEDTNEQIDPSEFVRCEKLLNKIFSKPAINGKSHSCFIDFFGENTNNVIFRLPA